MIRLFRRLKSVLKRGKVPSSKPPKINPQAVPDRQPTTFLQEKLLDGKTVFITGAGQNIGRSIALEMAQQGANVFFTDIDQGACDRLQQELAEHPVQCKSFVADIRDISRTNEICEYLDQQNHQIDILINNVGMTPADHPSEIGIAGIDLEKLRHLFETNLFSPLYLTKQIANRMVKQQGDRSIIFITSVHQASIARWVSYSSSKAALQMVVEELAVDLAGYGIRVNGIAPGWVAEDQEGNLFHQPYMLLTKTSIHPRYIGRAAVYLASDYFSQFTTGTILKIDAGVSLYNYRVAQHPLSSNPSN